MKKSIAVITNSDSRVAKHIHDNLKKIFIDEIDINNYYVTTLDSGVKIEEDLVVLMIKEMGVGIINQVKNKNAMITIQRTVREEYLYDIYTIPDEVEVLVVNDAYETTLETISLLYQLGLKNIKLIPFKKGTDYSHIKIAITPDEVAYVPKHIEKIINIGQRVIDMTSLVQIINRLDMNTQEISRRLLEYSKEIVSYSMGINKTLKELHAKNEELKTLLDLSSDGILMTNAEDKVMQYNQALTQMLKIKSCRLGTEINDLLGEEFAKTFKLAEIEEKLFNISSRDYLVSKKPIHYYGQNSGFSYNFKDVTQVKELERTLNKQMCEKGLVAKYTFDSIYSKSTQMINMIDVAKRMAMTDMTVFIAGESGTGKELFAQSIHNASPRNTKPFVAVNCGALSESLLESELFGYEAGAFTGALKNGKTGLFEQAHKGTIFLDEIGDMSKVMQTKLLRVLQEKQVMRVGGKHVVDIDVRIVVATHKDLFEMVESGQFRKDLYFRINVFPIELPSLKDRSEDILELLYRFVDKNIKLDLSVVRFLENYEWGGNIRELKNVATYFRFLNKDQIGVEDLPPYLLRNHMKKMKVDKAECKCVEEEASVYEEFDMPINLNLLKIMGMLKEENKSVGRNKLSEMLSENGVSLTPAEVRKQLEYMKNNSLIDSKSGRSGSILSSEGYKNYRKYILGKI